MAPKKKEVQKVSLAEFLGPTNPSSSWADEVEDTYGTQPLPSSDRRTGGGTSYGGGNTSSYTDRGYSSIRDNLPQTLPTQPPYTAHLGNLSYDATQETVTEFFEGCKVVNIRIIEDRELARPKGFAYAEFEDVEGLKQALTLDGANFQGRSIRIKIADPPKDRGDGGGAREFRDLDWGARRGPLEDLPGQSSNRRGGGDFGDRRGGGDFGDRRGGGDFGDRRGGGDFGDRRPPREPQADDGKVRDFGNWERKGPLSPVAQPERAESRDGSRAPRPLEAGRSESYRGARKASPAAWGPGESRGGDGSRPPRREFAERPERPERVPTAAEKDMQWRTSMRPDLANKSPVQSREGSEAPSSPAGGAPAQPAGRPKLNLAKRTVSDAPAIVSPALLSASDPKANPFGAARPIDTAAREKLIEEKRVQALKEKKEADEKAKEERRLAKEAAVKEAAEKAEAEAAAKAEADAAEAAEAAKPKADSETTKENSAATNDAGEQKLPVRPREPKEPRENVANPKSRAIEGGSWRNASGGAPRGTHAPSGPRRGGGPRGGPGGLGGRSESGRGPRPNGNNAVQAPQSPVVEQNPVTPAPVEDDGWTTVAPQSKGRRTGGRP